jgi:D-lactate dehydrogenase (cytochrome)
MDIDSFKVALKHSNLPNPLSETYPFYVLIETHGSNMDHDQEKLGVVLENLLTEGLALDGTLAQDQTQIGKIWSIRELIPEAIQHLGKPYKYDVSIPLPDLYNVVQIVKSKLADKGHYDPTGKDTDALIREVCGYGHIGDGNLHLNIVAKEASPKVSELLEPFIFEVVQTFQGSISAEHGLGLQKAKFIQYSKSPTMIKTMQSVKKLLDPNNILNPYKYLPASN